MKPPAHAAAAPRALSASKLRSALSRLKVEQGSWAVALSGGPDSLALAALLADIAPVTAFIVDHGLRAESAREAQFVKREAARIGIKAHILKWQGDKPATGIMAAARQARYRLLIETAQKHECTHLFLAHHQDDQVETVAMRMAEGSGALGLAGIPALSQLGEVTLVRPLLGFTKAQLVATCAGRGLRPVDDPSNRNTRYTRVRFRQQELDREHILSVQRVAAKRRNKLLQQIAGMPSPAKRGRVANVCEPGGGTFQLQTPPSLTLPRSRGRGDMRREALRIALQYTGQEDKPIRQEALDDLLGKMKAGKGATLAGCIVHNGLVVREPSAIAPLSLKAGRHRLWWDKRWWLEFRLTKPATLAPLGKNANWRALKNTQWIEELAGPMRAALPALWQDGRLLRVLEGRWLPWYRPLRQFFAEN